MPAHMLQPRRTALRGWVRGLLSGMALGLVLGISGCGFHLRGSQTFVFQTLAITPEKGSPLALDLARYLGATAVPLGPTQGQPAAQVVLDIVSEQREKVVVGVSTAGQVREMQLRLTVRCRLRTLQGEELLPEFEIAQVRDISFSESAALAKEAEEAFLYRDMQADIVQQLLRRLAAVQRLTAS